MGAPTFVPLTPYEMIAAETVSSVSLWEALLDHPEDCVLRPQAAVGLLATWAGLRRLVGPPPEPALDACVRRHETKLRTILLAAAYGFAERWRLKAEELKGEIPVVEYVDRDEAEARYHATLEVWREWDEFHRAAAGLDWPDDAWRRFSFEFEQAEWYLADNVGLFFPIVRNLSEELSASRTELADTDFRLWETLCKHRRVEEAHDLKGASDAEA